MFCPVPYGGKRAGSVTTAKAEFDGSVTGDGVAVESVTPAAKQYVIPAKPYIEKPFTFVQPLVCSDRELALKFTNGMNR